MSDYEPITTLLVTALRGTNSGERDNALSAAARKMMKLGFDIHDLGIYDSKVVIGGVGVSGAGIGPGQIIRSKNTAIANLTKERDDLLLQVDGLQQKLSKKLGTEMPSKTTRNDRFDWTKFPEDEDRICLAFANGNRDSAAKTAKDLTISLHQRGFREIILSEGIIKQRLNNNPPPKCVVDLITPNATKATWAELWYLGTKIVRRAWKQELFSRLNLNNRISGEDISNITPEMLTSLRELAATVERRTGAKSNGETKKFIIQTIIDAGAAGITRRGVIDLDIDNTNITKRFTEIIDTGIVIELAGRLIHMNFKDQYPEEWAIAEDKRLTKLTR